MKTKDLVTMAMMVSFISVSAQISIPLGPIPFTLQTTMILLMSLILGSKKALSVTLIYILIGAVGFPVFANFKGGIDKIFLQTGGFIMSFPLMAYISGLFAKRYNKRAYMYLVCFLGVTLNFIFGCIYFMYITKLNITVSLGYTVIPFIPTTIIQIILAVELSFKIKDRIYQK